MLPLDSPRWIELGMPLFARHILDLTTPIPCPDCGAPFRAYDAPIHTLEVDYDS